jgi:hypothetical protein
MKLGWTALSPVADRIEQWFGRRGLVCDNENVGRL